MLLFQHSLLPLYVKLNNLMHEKRQKHMDNIKKIKHRQEKKYISKFQRSFAKDMIDQTEIEYSIIKFNNQFYSSMKTKVYDYKRNKDVEVLISTVDLKEKLSLILNDKNKKYKKTLIDQAEKLLMSINVFLPNSYFNKKQNIYVLKNEIEKQL